MNGKIRCRAALRMTCVAALASLVFLVIRAAAQIALSADVAKPQAVNNAAPPTNPLDAQRAYGYLQELCAIRPRPSGSAGMQKQQALLEDFFKKAGAKVTLQRFRANDPQRGQQVAMTNIIVEWHPERK